MNYMNEQTKDIDPNTVKIKVYCDGDSSNHLNIRPDTWESIRQLLIEQEEKEKAGHYTKGWGE